MASIDRLSALPDCVICHILSFLPTKISMSTSILARRWKFLWAHVPSFDLDRWTSSSDIISRVILLHKVQNINTFRLCYEDSDCSEYELEAWITTAIARNVKNVDICLHYHLPLPLCLFTCKSLVDLRLTCGVFIPATVYLPCLRKLHFIDGCFCAGGTLSTLLTGCPVLEELVMDKIINHQLVCCNIFSPTIRRLAVEFQFLGLGFYSDHRLAINAPAIRYLQLRDCVSYHVSTQMLDSLIEADICLDYNIEVEDGGYYIVSVLNFVDSLFNVKYLKLSSGRMFSVGVFANHQSKSIMKFDNLIKLELAADWLFLTKFLESADNVEVLIIREVEENLKHWMEPERVPTCLLSCLKTKKIDQLGYTEQEFDMVGYFLRNSKVLKRMEIYFRDGIDSNTKFDAQHRISSFHQGSDACELAFYSVCSGLNHLEF